MRTTIRVDDELLAEAKALAARSHRSLNSVVEDALREMLSRRQGSGEPRPRVELPTYGGAGTMPGVDPEDWGDIKRILEDEDTEHARQPQRDAADAAR